MFLKLAIFYIIIPVLINVAFITLLERKIMALSQNRKGPLKVSFMGIFQPFSDAVKLFLKNNFIFNFHNFIFFSLSPLLALILALSFWFNFNFKENFLNMNFNILLILMLLSFNIYPMLISGWSSNSSYSFLGAIRGVAQTISYEIILIFFFLLLIFNLKDFNTFFNLKFNLIYSFFFNFPFLIFIWLFSCLAETNRTPFDFSEGESELVSGFNTEYMSSNFALIFLSEYSNILFLSILSMSLVMYFNFIFQVFLALIFSSFWLITRSTYPRHRFDKLMMICWKTLIFSIMLILTFFLFYQFLYFWNK